ncbi:MAG TPA: hypothetical protein IAB65_01925 [Candidatus Onthocola stercorigallinarum]|nr:hypothetical protein [Candidatus Onthocola stercorigallinarum]
MTFKEYCKRSDEIRMKHDILLLADLIELYDERYKNKKEKVPIKYIYNELHDDILYTKEQEEFIISEAIKLSEKQNL